ncbi:MAG: methionine--tRNA ligase, partial [Candidatus Altiarchaeales archaeon]|nr:methionine--tRNA ligase [Candidatus Altiarchaeales archaeon]
MSKRLLVTAALPYANGPLHVGHIAGAYLPADIYTRYKRLKGFDVAFICGTDEHGTPITVTADREGVSPQDIVDKYHLMQKKAFDGLLIDFDNFSATSRRIHHETAQKFFQKILEGGHIYSETVERPYCPDCGRFLPDRYVRGVCPKCETPDERGDQCEACGIQLEPHELVAPYCIICGGEPVRRETKHWFFRLSEFSEKLRTWIESNTHWPANARNFSLGWIREGLEDRAITRDLSWGVKVPLKEAGDKVLYVWFDAPIGYVSSTKEWGHKKGVDWEQYWRDADIIHFIGKDNIPFHAVIWPAMLMAEGEYNLPWQIASNEYLNLEGRKMSTSRGWVLWVHDLLEEYPADVVRYYLTSITPQSSDSDFSLEDFRLRVNNELIAAYGNFVNRTLTFIANKRGAVVPAPGEYGEAEEKLFA